MGRNYGDLNKQCRISNIVLVLFSYVVENERANIRQRQAEGIASAKARGAKFDRPKNPLPDNFE